MGPFCLEHVLRAPKNPRRRDDSLAACFVALQIGQTSRSCSHAHTTNASFRASQFRRRYDIDFRWLVIGEVRDVESKNEKQTDHENFQSKKQSTFFGPRKMKRCFV